jgi:hypothetical protein
MQRTLTEAKSLLDAHQQGIVLVDWRLPEDDSAVIADLAAVQLASRPPKPRKSGTIFADSWNG